MSQQYIRDTKLLFSFPFLTTPDRNLILFMLKIKSKQKDFKKYFTYSLSFPIFLTDFCRSRSPISSGSYLESTDITYSTPIWVRLPSIESTVKYRVNGEMRTAKACTSGSCSTYFLLLMYNTFMHTLYKEMIYLTILIKPVKCCVRLWNMLSFMQCSMSWNKLV